LSPIARPSPWTLTRRVLAELGCALLPLALLLWTLREPLASIGQGLWGPERPWGNGDFIGNVWCWWREAELQRGGIEWLEATGWPSGGGVLNQLFPNRLDAWLALPFFELDSWWVTWNVMALVFLVLAVLGVFAAARLAGASRLAAVGAGLILAMSPTWLHELGWGRMAGFTVWPGIWALAAVALALRAPRARRPWIPLGAGGLLLTLQTVAYPYHGLAAGLACAGALLLAARPWAQRLRMLAVLTAVAVLTTAPWLLALASDFSALAEAPPPAGYTSLPLAGALGLPLVPERFRLLPLAVPLALLALASARARPWAAGGLVVLGLALGPTLFWTPQGATLPSPTAGLMAVSSWLARMHHPLRAAPLGLAAAAVGVALLLDPARREQRWLRAAGLGAVMIGALWMRGDLRMVTTWNQPGEPPGVDAARWLAEQGDGPVADVLSGQHMAGFALQPWHRRPLLESVQGYTAAAGGTWSPEQERMSGIVGSIAAGDAPSSAELDTLGAFGVEALLVVDRAAWHPAAPDATAAAAALTAALGPADYADDEASAWLISE